MISFVNTLVNLLLSNKSVSFDNLKQVFIFLSTIIFFRLAETVKIGKKTANIIFGANILISIIYLYCKRTYPQEYIPYSANYLTINFSNPNLTGMFLLISLLYMCLSFFYFENIFLKGISILLAVSNFDLMLQTESRNPLIAFILFLAILLISFFKEDLSYSKFFNFAVNISPIAFVFFYLTFIDKIIQKGWLSFLVSEGKNLNSRVYAWKLQLSNLGDKWLFGDYANLMGNAHNSHLVILCSFGLVVLILVIVFTYKLTYTLTERIKNKFQLYCLAAVFAVTFMGFGEGALYSGGIGIYILSGVFLIFANSDLDLGKRKRVAEEGNRDKTRL